MRLNPDCIRDILLTVEETVSFGKYMKYPSAAEYPRLAAYSQEEIFYHISQCKLSGLLTKVIWVGGPSCSIEDLSPLGHEFLANIRNETNWNRVKEIAKSIGSFSLDLYSKLQRNGYKPNGSSLDFVFGNSFNFEAIQFELGQTMVVDDL